MNSLERYDIFILRLGINFSDLRSLPSFPCLKAFHDENKSIGRSSYFPRFLDLFCACQYCGTWLKIAFRGGGGCRLHATNSFVFRSSRARSNYAIAAHDGETKDTVGCFFSRSTSQAAQEPM